jgi:hypothetical protein
MDIIDRLRIVASMKKGDTFPPPGMDNPEDWGSDGWNVGMSRMCSEAANNIALLRAELAGRTHQAKDLQFIARVFLVTTILATITAVIGWLV